MSIRPRRHFPRHRLTLTSWFILSYVIHGTHNVTLEENVAFDTFGHCFLLEDGGEWDNKFLYNLGATTKRPETIIRPQESDQVRIQTTTSLLIGGYLNNSLPPLQVTPTTFWMTTMTNHFIGNVAAAENLLRGRPPTRCIRASERL